MSSPEHFNNSVKDSINSTDLNNSSTTGIAGNQYAELTRKIETHCILALCLTGTVGNILTIIILGRKRNRGTSIAVILLFLSVSDLFIIFTGYFSHWIFLLWKFDFREVHFLSCKLHMFLTYYGIQFSSWMLVLVTCERAYSVISPYTAKRICSRRTTITVIIITAVVLMLLNGHFLVGMGPPNGKNYTERICIFISPGYGEFIISAWGWIDFFVTFAIPFLFIVIGNTLIILKMKKNQRDRKIIVARQDSSSSSEQQTNSLTYMLILLSVIFIVCTGPASVMNLMLSYLLSLANDRQDQVLLFVKEMAFLLSGLNATLNFFLYVLSGSKFRGEVKALVGFKGSTGHAMNE